LRSAFGSGSAGEALLTSLVTAGVDMSLLDEGKLVGAALGAGMVDESVVEGVGDVSAGIGVVGCCWTWSVVGVELLAGSVVVCAET
jgi:hypothetical protein